MVRSGWCVAHDTPCHWLAVHVSTHQARVCPGARDPSIFILTILSIIFFLIFTFPLFDLTYVHRQDPADVGEEVGGGELWMGVGGGELWMGVGRGDLLLFFLLSFLFLYICVGSL